MARRKPVARPRYAAFVLVIAAVAVAAWFGWRHLHDQPGAAAADKIAPVNVSAGRVDPANEGRRIRVAGNLVVDKPARDTELDIGADTPMLFRRVEMYQWREHCAAAGCRYDTAWSVQPVDSAKFRTPNGHENPAAPFVSARFAAKDIHLGAFSVDPELAAAQLRVLDFPVRAASLPSNLAASFRDADGALYAGAGDPAHPAVGALRVSYRILPIGAVTLIGVQHGTELGAH